MWYLAAIPIAATALAFSALLRWRIKLLRWNNRVRQLTATPAGQISAADSSPEADFFRGCFILDQGDPVHAVREFQRAYHRQPQYESAAILAFTCMKMNDSDLPRLLQHLLDTWAEMRRGNVPSGPREKRFLHLTCPSANSLPPLASPLARTFWALPIKILKQQIETALNDQPHWARPLFNTPDGSATRPIASAAAPTAML